MKTAFLSSISLLISVLALSSFAVASTSDLEDRRAVLKAVAGVSMVFKGLSLGAFSPKSGYWEAKGGLVGRASR